jgi:hypothetical protein
MDKFIEKGNEIRKQAKRLVLSFMNSDDECRVSGPGIKQAQIFLCHHLSSRTMIS